MRLAFTPEQEALQIELRAYFMRLAQEVEGDPDGEPTYLRYIRRMGGRVERSWAGVSNATIDRR